MRDENEEEGDSRVLTGKFDTLKREKVTPLERRGPCSFVYINVFLGCFVLVGSVNRRFIVSLSGFFNDFFGNC